DGGSKKASGSTSVVVEECADCRRNFACPAVTVNSPDIVSEGKPIEFTAFVAQIPMGATFNWSISAGKFIGDNGTSKIRVDTSEIHNQQVIATVTIGGLDPGCNTTASSSTFVRGAQAFPGLDARLFTEYSALSVDEENVRLGGLAHVLQSNPQDSAA